MRSTKTVLSALLSISTLVILMTGGCPQGDSALNSISALFGRSPDSLRPTVTQVAPQRGPAAGGTKVTIVGENFPLDAAVLFGQQNAASVLVLNATTIEATTPAALAGTVDVTVATSTFDPVVVTGAFTYEEAQAARIAPVSVANVTPSSGPAAGGTRVTITGANFKANTNVLFGGQLSAASSIVNEQIINIVTPAHQPGIVDVQVLTPGEPAITLAGGFEYLSPDQPPPTPQDPGAAPRVVGAVATSNTSVQVVFSKAMGPSANVASNYEIRGTGTAFLIVSAAALRANDATIVDLTTLSQAADIYTVHVSGVQDIFGQNIAAPEGIESLPSSLDPSRARFAGIPPGSRAEQVDTDGDGFADWFEMAGWDIQVTVVNGTTTTVHVTSDPFNPDTDGDGLTDAEENANSFDPRTDDTDADLVGDFAEFNEWFSDPTNQDTDGDRISDHLETTFFLTSPILADTDGDQWADDDELFNRNRNPRRSDLPLPQIRVGTIGVFIKETYSFTDEQGNTFSDFTAKTTTLSQSTSRTQSTSDTQSSENTDAFSQELGTEFSIGTGEPFGGFKINAKVGFEQTRQRGYSSTVSQESVESSSQDFQESRQFGSTFSENRTFSRTIDEARLNMDVTISNLGDVAFSLTDLELAAFVRDPVRKVDVPLGTLLSEREIQFGQTQTFNLGPFDADRGPFIFRDIQLFPNVAAELRESPSAVTVKIANFNIRDESGRLFSFSSQDINDRTAGIIIDYGNGDVEAHRVATANKFGPDGRSLGITMGEALTSILGIAHVANEAAAIANPNAPEIRGSYGTVVGLDGVEILTRVRGVQTTVDGPVRDRKFWAIISSVPLPEGVNFSATALKAGQNYSLQFVQDRDADGLFASTEFIYGSSDDNPDTDGDGIGDFDEVRTGWVIGIPGNARRIFSDPTLVDSDGDGLSDAIERDYSTNPRSADSDEDGIKDRDEVNGYELIVFDGDDDPTNNPVIQLAQYSDASVIEGGNGLAETTAIGDDIQFVAVGGGVLPGTPLILPGPNGRIDSTPNGDDFRSFGATIIAGANQIVETQATGDDVQLFAFGTTGIPANAPIIVSGLNGRIDTPTGGDDLERAAHEQLFASDPLRRNTDADALPDGRELRLGSNPNNPRDAGTVVDTDFDGMVDAEEQNGWDITVNGATTHVTSDTLSADTDGDGLPDLMERIFRMNPRARDTDGDTIADRVELDPNDPRNFFPPGAYDDFNARCADAAACSYAEPSNPVGTNPLRADTDQDGRTDSAEISVGWFVRVFNQPQREVFSSPFTADADSDQLNDSQELTALTDPGNNNTDGDNRPDGYEVNTRHTDPLKPDMIVTFTYTSYTINGDCDGLGFEGLELEGGPLRITLPSGTVVDLRTFDCPCGDENCRDDDNEGDTIDITDVGQTFLLEIGQSFTASCGTLRDHDIELCSTHGLDDNLGTFSESISYPASAGGRTFTVGDTDCGITVNASIGVD
ncbi:MAG: IPT/TIG domain-containing protein [Phycisphaerales bacterium]|nr:IPT/TIG domain-containing protein [Phycisphaerales bacterium]